MSRLARELLAEGCLVERECIKTSVGRKPTLLAFNPNYRTVIGAHIQTDKLECALLNLGGYVLARWESIIEREPMPEQVLELLFKAVNALRQENTLGIGVAISGLIDAKTGKIVFSPVLQWEGINIREVLEKGCTLPVYVENDANALAAAELLHGAGRNYKDFLCVMISDGLGCGVVLGGRLYRGTLGGAGELGHTTIDLGDDAPICRCGEQGCLEEFCSKRALNREAQRLGLKDWRVLGEMARMGDPYAQKAFLRFGYYLGVGLKNAVNLLNPEAVIIGGDLTEFADLFLNTVKEVVRKHCFPGGRTAPEIMLWQVGKEGFLIGAGGLVVEEFLSSPIRT
ncbi:MAG: ROK family protein [Candidatus Bipolaricaulota bacterium]|nr:ROK family protein [Candidatus Bipolaricaulota bacterium]MDW8151697.1 ROK family protein [Candidatus Bipolaricaulota bacterium]